MIQPKFKIGNVVKNVTTGVDNTYTTVVGIEHGLYYKLKTKMVGMSVHVWDKMFPDWEQKYVYTCRSPIPVKNMSYLEYCTHVGIPSSNEGKAEYDERIPEVSYLQYSEDDLELFLEDADDMTDEHIAQMYGDDEAA